MDLKTQAIIYALDELSASMRTHMRVLSQLKQLIAPEQKPEAPAEIGESTLFFEGKKLYESKPEATPTPEEVLKHHKHVFTFTPMNVEPYPPCLHCPQSRRCMECSDLSRCNEFECDSCNYDELCGSMLGEK